MGYKLPKIKEYCETDYSLDDLQELFMEMWENELEKINTTLRLHFAIDRITSELDCITDEELQSKFDGITDFSVSNAINGTKWLGDVVAEDQAIGLYDELRCKDYTPDQIADIANYVYLTMELTGGFLNKHNKGDTV